MLVYFLAITGASGAATVLAVWTIREIGRLTH